MIKKLFSANPARIGRFDGPPTSDAVPASLVDGTPGDLKADLIVLLLLAHAFFVCLRASAEIPCSN